MNGTSLLWQLSNPRFLTDITPIEPPIPAHINRPTRLEPFQIDLNKVWRYINKKSLFVLQWGMRGKGASDQDLKSCSEAGRIEC